MQLIETIDGKTVKFTAEERRMAALANAMSNLSFTLADAVVRRIEATSCISSGWRRLSDARQSAFRATLAQVFFGVLSKSELLFLTKAWRDTLPKNEGVLYSASDPLP